MRFALLSLITVASAAGVRRADYGSWNVSITIYTGANGYVSRNLASTYTSTNLSETSSTCTYLKNPGHTTVDTCDDPSLSYSNTGSRVGIKQTIGGVALSGGQDLTTACPPSGQPCVISGTIPAVLA